MPRLSFEEPKGGPLAKAAQSETPAEETQQLSELFVEEDELEEEAAQREGRHRRQASRDSVLVILKAATFAVAIALVGSIVLLATSGEDDPAAKSPDVPRIADSREPSTDPTTTAAIVAPEVRSNTTAIVPPPVTQPSVPSTQPQPPSGGNQFVRVGDKCDTRGAHAFTERFEPVVCDARRGNEQLVWRKMFR